MEDAVKERLRKRLSGGNFVCDLADGIQEEVPLNFVEYLVEEDEKEVLKCAISCALRSLIQVNLERDPLEKGELAFVKRKVLEAIKYLNVPLL